MTTLDQRQQAQLADLLDRIADLETQVRAIPSRTTSSESQNLVLEISQTGHGFTNGDVVRHNGTTWVLASANDIPADEKLGIVGLVLGANAFLVVLAGSLCLQGLTPWTIYYLGTSGDLVTAPPAHLAIRRAVLLHTTGDVCQLVAPHLASAHGHRLADLRDVDTTSLADGNGLVWDATAGKFKPGSSLPTDPGGTVAKNKILAGPTTGADAAPSFRLMVTADLPSVAAKAVLANATNGAAVPTAFTPTAADQILMATATGLAWDQIQVASMKLAAGPRIIGRTGAGAGTAEEISVSARLALASSILDLATSGAAAGSYGSATQVPTITVDTYGRVTAVSNTTISIPGSAVTSAVANATFATSAGSATTAGFATTAGGLSGTLSVSGGGTGATSLTGYVVGNGAAAMSAVSTIPWTDISSTPTTVAGYGITDAVPTSRNISTSAPLSGGGPLSSNLTISLGTVPADKGGTGQTTYAVGDVLYASAATTISKLAAVAVGKALVSKGTTTAPAWETLTPTHLSTTAGFAIWAKATTAGGAMTELTAANDTVLWKDGAGNLAFAKVKWAAIDSTQTDAGWAVVTDASGVLTTTRDQTLGKGAGLATSTQGSKIVVVSSDGDYVKISSGGIEYFDRSSDTTTPAIELDWSGTTYRFRMYRHATSATLPVIDISTGDLSTAFLTGFTSGRAVKLREVDVVGSGGTAQKAMIPMSAGY